MIKIPFGSVVEVALMYFRLKTFEVERVCFLGLLCLAIPKATRSTVP